MKNLVLVGAVWGICFVSLNSCTKDKTPPPPDCIQQDTVNTYLKSAKVVFDIECAVGGCHDANTAEHNIRLDNYENAVEAAKTNPLFYCVMDFTCTPYMPDGNTSPMDTFELNALKRWRDNCYPE